MRGAFSGAEFCAPLTPTVRLYGEEAMANINAVLILLLSLTIVSPAIALDIQAYERFKAISPNEVELYINGVGQGYLWSNTALKQRGQPPLYCPPGDLALNGKNHLDIINSQIAKFKEYRTKKIPVELILYYGLIDSFPCSK